MFRVVTDSWDKVWPGEGEADVSRQGWRVNYEGNWQKDRRYSMRADFANGWRIEATGGLDPNGKPVVNSMSFLEIAPGTLEVTTNLLREMPSGRILSELRQTAAEWADRTNQALEHYSESDWLDLCRAPRWPGRGYETPGITFAAMAFTYLRFVTEGNTKPVEALAEHMDCSRATASARLAQARNGGFLDKPGERNRGGRLTAKSERLLGLVPVDDSGVDA